MLRTITLALMLVISVGTMLPLATSTAHGLRQNAVSSKRNGPRFRRHSRAWWRRYRARMKRRRAAALAHRRATLNAFPAKSNALGQPPVSSAGPLATLPEGWNNAGKSNNGELRFRTDTGNSAEPGQAALAVVAHSRPTPEFLPMREQKRLLSGVSFSDLRRIVIDKMVASGGWVINDYERQVTGQRVYVVTAQTPGDGRSTEKSWNFYFTEIDGRIYSLTTNTPQQYSGRMEVEAERFIASLYKKTEPTTQASR